jgi:hypothetical protein
MKDAIDINRRNCFSPAALATGSLFSPLHDFAFPIELPGSFDFVFFTYAHIEIADLTGVAVQDIAVAELAMTKLESSRR